jgi:predicted TIM-barrel fold metal-dependent hydrolase
MTHGGQLDGSGYSMTDAEFVMRRTPNLVMETSGLFADELLERLPTELGAHRVVFGSHSPWLNLGLELKRIERAHISEAIRRAIGSENAKTLLGI